MGISSGGFGRPFPLGPTPVPTRPPARGSPVLRALWVGGSGRPAPARPRAGERCGTAYPSGGPGSYEASGRSAPGAPPARRGSPFLPRNGEKEGRGSAPGPRFYGPLAVARSFWGLLSLIQQRGYSLRYAKTDLERIFREKYAQEAFSERKPPNQGTHIGPEIAPPPEQCATTAKTSECQRAGPKKGGRGATPRDSLRPGFL